MCQISCVRKLTLYCGNWRFIKIKNLRPRSKCLIDGHRREIAKRCRTETDRYHAADNRGSSISERREWRKNWRESTPGSLLSALLNGLLCCNGAYSDHFLRTSYKQKRTASVSLRYSYIDVNILTIYGTIVFKQVKEYVEQIRKIFRNFN